MTRWVALALLAAMIPTGSPAFQARESLARGGSYFDQCVARAKDYSACIGYFMGMADAPVMNADKSADQAVYCLPAGATYEQNRDVFHTYLRENPQIRDVSTHMLFLLAMNASFPCKNSPKLSVDPATGEVFMSVSEPQG